MWKARRDPPLFHQGRKPGAKESSTQELFLSLSSLLDQFLRAEDSVLNTQVKCDAAQAAVIGHPGVFPGCLSVRPVLTIDNICEAVLNSDIRHDVYRSEPVPETC